MTREEMARLYAAGAVTPVDSGSAGRKYGTRMPIAVRKSPTCEVCGKPVPTNRRTKCSEECMTKHNLTRAANRAKRLHVPTPAKSELRECDICTCLFTPAADAGILCGSRVCESARNRKLKIIAQKARCKESNRCLRTARS